MAGLARKLPHYGKYSWLAFAGTEPANVAKGEWPTADSPLNVNLQKKGTPLALSPLPKRAALAEPPAAYAADKLLAHVNFLAAPEREGRGFGSAGLEASRDYIRDQFAAAGLKPGGDNGTYFQDFKAVGGADKQERTLQQRGGRAAGRRPEVQGRGGAAHRALRSPRPRLARRAGGRPRQGASRRRRQRQRRRRADRDGEGAGGRPAAAPHDRLRGLQRRGSRAARLPPLREEPGARAPHRHLRRHQHGHGRPPRRPTRCRSSPPRARGNGPSCSAASPPSRACRRKSIPGASESSDQRAFIEAGVPGVQLFAGAGFDYHRPSDTADKVDGAGMVRVATVATEAISYLASTDKRLSATAATPLTGHRPGAGHPDAPRVRGRRAGLRLPGPRAAARRRGARLPRRQGGHEGRATSSRTSPARK